MRFLRIRHRCVPSLLLHHYPDVLWYRGGSDKEWSCDCAGHWVHNNHSLWRPELNYTRRSFTGDSIPTKQEKSLPRSKVYWVREVSAAWYIDTRSPRRDSSSACHTLFFSPSTGDASYSFFLFSISCTDAAKSSVFFRSLMMVTPWNEADVPLFSFCRLLSETASVDKKWGAWTLFFFFFFCIHRCMTCGRLTLFSYLSLFFFSGKNLRLLSDIKKFVYGY